MMMQARVPKDFRKRVPRHGLHCKDSLHRVFSSLDRSHQHQEAFPGLLKADEHTLLWRQFTRSFSSFFLAQDDSTIVDILQKEFEVHERHDPRQPGSDKFARAQPGSRFKPPRNSSPCFRLKVPAPFKSLSNPSARRVPPKKRMEINKTFLEEQMSAVRAIDWGTENSDLLKGIAWQDNMANQTSQFEIDAMAQRRQVSAKNAAEDFRQPSSWPPRASVIRVLWDEIRCKQWSSEIENHLNSLDIHLSPLEVEWVLRGKRPVDVGWGFFNWAGSRPGYKHSCGCYTIMIGTLGSALRFDLLEQLLDDMQQHGREFSIATLNTLIGVFGTSEMIGKAEEYYFKLGKLGLKPNAFTYKSMLHAYVKSGQPSKALEIYLKMRSVGQPLDNLSYNALMDGLGKDGQVESACNVFRDMKAHGYVPDVYTYTILIHILGRIGKVDGAIKIFNEMVARECKPNRYTFNTLLVALLNGDKFEDGLEVFRRMLKSGTLPNTFTYNHLVNILGKAEKLNMLYEVLNHSEGSFKNEAHEMAIHSLARMGYFKEAHNLFMRLITDGHRHSEASYLTVIESCCKTDDIDVALVLMREMKQCGHQLHTSACNMIILTFRNKGKLTEAINLFEEMKMKGPPPDIVTYNTLIAGLSKVGKQDLVLHLFKEMEMIGCTPNVISYNTLVHGFSRLGDIHSTREWLRKMEDIGMSPDIATYSSMIDCFGKMGLPDAAVEVFHQMTEKGCCPTFQTYNNLLSCLARAGRTQDALSYYRQMLEQGCLPDALTFAILDRIYASNPNLDRAQLQAEIQKVGLVYEFHNFAQLQPQKSLFY